MRIGARCAAALALALALAAAGCELVDSLTPFGVGDRGEDTSRGTYTGIWQGATASGGAITFQVISGAVQNLVLTHLTATCTTTFTIDATAAIDGVAFDFSVPLDPQGTFALGGSFTSPDASSGRYSFSSMVTSPKCPSAGQGSFTAAKTPLINP